MVFLSEDFSDEMLLVLVLEKSMLLDEQMISFHLLLVSISWKDLQKEIVVIEEVKPFHWLNFSKYSSSMVVSDKHYSNGLFCLLVVDVVQKLILVD